jgi:hypothetical protein
MGMTKNYIVELLHLCSDHHLGQDAVEWGIMSGQIKLTYEKERDLRLIMGEPGRPETGKYSELIEAYRRTVIVSEERASLPQSCMAGQPSAQLRGSSDTRA